MDASQFYSANETARLMGYTPASWRNIRSDGRDPLRSHKIGQTVVYLTADVDAYLATHGPMRQRGPR